MGQVINLFSSGQEIDLKIGEYKIDILGGWGVTLGQFEISFSNKQSGRVINCERSFWSVQSVVSGKRARFVFVFKVDEQSLDKVNFINPESLKVKYSDLLLTLLFQAAMPEEEISIYIH